MEKNVGGAKTEYIYGIDGNVVAEVNGSNGGWQVGYVYLGGQLLAQYSGGTTYFAHTDHLGSPRVLTDINGSGYDNYDYLPFGETRSGGWGTTHKFTGDERDSETGLDHTLFRQYSSSLGRWSSPDPLAGDISDPQSLNRYSYVQNGPLTSIDPLGMDDCNAGNKFCDYPLMDSGFGSGANSDFVQWEKVPTRIDNPFVRIITGAGPGMVSASFQFPNGGGAPIGADTYSSPAELTDSSTSVLINDPSIGYWTPGLAVFTPGLAPGANPALQAAKQLAQNAGKVFKPADPPPPTPANEPPPEIILEDPWWKETLETWAEFLGRVYRSGPRSVVPFYYIPRNYSCMLTPCPAPKVPI